MFYRTKRHRDNWLTWRCVIVSPIHIPVLIEISLEAKNTKNLSACLLVMWKSWLWKTAYIIFCKAHTNDERLILRHRRDFGKKTDFPVVPNFQTTDMWLGVIGSWLLLFIKPFNLHRWFLHLTTGTEEYISTILTINRFRLQRQDTKFKQMSDTTMWDSWVCCLVQASFAASDKEM